MSQNRLSSLDVSFLELESPSAHMHVGWAAAFRRPASGPAPSFEQLRDHVARRLSRAPRYRQKIAAVPLGIHDPVWVDDHAFDIDRHVWHSRTADLDWLTDEVMSRQLDRDHPLWELWIADELADGRIGVVGKAHHAMVDGLAAVELGTLLLDVTPEPAPDPAAENGDGWRPRRMPTRIDLLVDGISDRARDAVEVARWPLSLARRPGGIVDEARDALGGLMALVDSLRPAPAQPLLNEQISARRHLAHTHRPLAELKEVRSRYDATVNDVVLAVASGAVRRFLSERGYLPIALKAMVPVSMRASDGGSDLGNQISFVFVDLPCDEPDPLRRLATVKARIDARKSSGRPQAADRVLKALSYAPRPLQHLLAQMASSPRAFNLVVSNIPGPREPLYMLGCELEEVYPVVPIADGHALAIGVTTVKEEAFFGVYADPAALPDADLLADCLDESLDELLDLDREPVGVA